MRKNALSLEQRIRRLATHCCEEFRDHCDEVDLTGLGEHIFIELDLTEEQYDDADADYLIWHELDRQKLL